MGRVVTMAGQNGGNLRWVVCEALRAAGPALLADDGAFRSYVAAWGDQADPLVQTALAWMDAQALASLAQAVLEPEAASLARARYAMCGTLCQRGVGEDVACGVANAVAGGAADLYGVALPDLQASQSAYQPQPQQYQPQYQQLAYQQAQQPQQYPQQAVYAQPRRKRKFLLPLAIAGGLAAVAAIAALVFFVVLPMLGPSVESKGVWVCTSMTRQAVTESGTTTETTEYGLDEQGRLRSMFIHWTNGAETSEQKCSYLYSGYSDNDQLCTGEAGKRRLPGNESFDDPYEYRYSWEKDSEERVTKVTKSGEDLTQEMTYEYDRRGRIVKTTRNAVYGNGYGEFECCEFDSRGLRTALTLHVVDPSAEGEDADRQQVQTFKYERDLRGRVVSAKTVVNDSKTGRLMAEFMEDHEYDSDGNISVGHNQYIIYNDDGTTTEWTETFTYEYAYFAELDPWVAEQVRLGTVPTPRTF